MGENQIESTGNGEQTFSVPLDQQIYVQEGYLLGIRFGDAVNVMHYDECCDRDSSVLITVDTVPSMSVHSTYDFGTPHNDWDCRIYSIDALVREP